MSFNYSISNEVFSKFPDYCRGVVLAHDISNGDSPDELIAGLREAEEGLRAQLTAENIAAWIWRHIKPSLASLSAVRVFETPDCWAEYDG